MKYLIARQDTIAHSKIKLIDLNGYSLVEAVTLKDGVKETSAVLSLIRTAIDKGAKFQEISFGDSLHGASDCESRG